VSISSARGQSTDGVTLVLPALPPLSRAGLSTLRAAAGDVQPLRGTTPNRSLLEPKLLERRISFLAFEFFTFVDSQPCLQN